MVFIEEKYLKNVLNFLNKKIEFSNRIELNYIFLIDKIFYIYPEIINISQKSNLFVSTILYKIKHPLFDSFFIERATGVGKTIIDALENAVNNFMGSAFSGIINLTDEDFQEEIISNFFGIKKIWSVSFGNAIVIGAKILKNDFDFWEVIREKINLRLGNRKTYYIKIYAAKQANDSCIGEVRINNIVDTELSEDIKEYTKAWDSGKLFTSKKQFIFLYQGEATFIKFPFNSDEIYEMVKKTINIFTQYRTLLSDEALIDKIFGFTNDKIFATELFSLVPEICAKTIINFLKYSDKLIIYKDGDIKIEIFKSQLIAYEEIKNSIDSIIDNKVFDEKDIEFVSSCSSIYNLLIDLREKNIEFENLSSVTNAIQVPSNYFVR